MLRAANTRVARCSRTNPPPTPPREAPYASQSTKRPLLPSRKNHSAHLFFFSSGFTPRQSEKMNHTNNAQTAQRRSDRRTETTPNANEPTKSSHRCCKKKKSTTDTYVRMAPRAHLCLYFFTHDSRSNKRENPSIQTLFSISLFNFISSHSPFLLTHTTFTHDEKTKLSPKLRHKKKKKAAGARTSGLLSLTTHEGSPDPRESAHTSPPIGPVPAATLLGHRRKRRRTPISAKESPTNTQRR